MVWKLTSASVQGYADEVIDLVGLRVEGFYTAIREWFDFAVDPRTTVVLHTCIAEVRSYS